MKNKPLKKVSESVGDDDPLDHEIDFSKSRPNPYWLGMVDRRCVRLLAADVADAFPDDDAVNEALRSVLRMNGKRVSKKISANTAAAPKPKKKKARA
jgi:hypothetical protein